MKCEIPCKVKRLRCECCGMKIGQIYNAKTDSARAYVSVEISENVWTDDHWVGREELGAFFEFIDGDSNEEFK